MKQWKSKIAPLAGIVVLIVILGFVTRHQNQMQCSGVDIHVHSTAGMFFIDQTDVHHQIVNVADSIHGRKMIEIDVRSIENAIAHMPEVKTVDVFKTINGQLRVNVDLRVPVARIFQPDGASFYLDEAGEIMPLSTKYTARVLTVNGYVWRTKIPTDKEVPEITQWDQQQRDIYELAQLVKSDPFWNAQIQQVYVDENLEYVLIPRVGNYEIELGKMNDIEIKFQKLNAFYEQALSKIDWNKYKSINLKYKNQIVCSKK